MKHVVRNEGNACFSFSTSVVRFQVRVYPATALCCGACHVNVKPKPEEKSSLKLHACRASWKTFNDGPGHMHQNRPCPGFRRMRLNRSFRDTDGAWRDYSFLATFLRLEELKINSAAYFVFIKLLKEKHGKGSERVGFVASSGVRLQLWLTLALHVCYRQVQRRQNSAVLAFF